MTNVVHAIGMTIAKRASAVKAALRDPAVLSLDALHRRGRQWFCRSPWRDERTPSCSIRDLSDGLAFYDFGGDRGGDVLSVIAALHGLTTTGRDFVRVIELGEMLSGIVPGETPMPRARPRRTPPTLSPPTSEVLSLWDVTLPVALDADAVAWLEERGLDVDRVEERMLARVLPERSRLPRWARCSGRPWTETGHRLVLPTFNERGAIVSLHARRIIGADGPKTLWPAGHAAAGVFADALAQLLLFDGRAPLWWSPVTIIVAEGVPDYLTFATAYGDSESAPAVLGIAAGTWTQQIADRVPDGARLVIATHGDAAGTKYNENIVATVGNRMEVVEVRDDEAA